MKNPHLTEVYVERDIRRREIHVTLERGDTLAAPVQFVKPAEHDYAIPHTPTFALSPEEAQSMMTALWSNGIRPDKQDEFTQSERVAMSLHIDSLKSEVEFLRKVVGSQIGVST